MVEAILRSARPPRRRSGKERKRSLPELLVELRVVELRGLEPLTPSLRTRCATSCATAPDAVAADATISRQG
jgi:hypothetical protein